MKWRRQSDAKVLPTQHPMVAIFSIRRQCFGRLDQSALSIGDEKPTSGVHLSPLTRYAPRPLRLYLPK